MGLFSRRDTKSYYILKVHKIVDYGTAKSIESQEIIRKCVDFLKLSMPNDLPDVLDLNYGFKSWNSIDEFERFALSHQNVEIANFCVSYQGSRAFISFSNVILNTTERNPRGQKLVSLEIGIPALSIEIETIYSYLVDIFQNLKIDYGYITTLNERYDFITERKVKKKLFGIESEIRKEDNLWRKYGIALKNGYLKDLYSINILNKSHLNQKQIKECIANGLGDIHGLIDDLYCWELNDSEVLEVKKHLLKAKHIMTCIEGENSFLKAEDSKGFLEAMNSN